jgi:hypothetical protein
MNNTATTVMFVSILIACSQFIACTQRDTDSPKDVETVTNYPVEYNLSDEHWGQFRELIAIVNGQSTTLIRYEEQVCINVVKVADFNKNGFDDVLVEHVTGCGGNCCGNSYQVFSFDGSKFHSTETVGYDWNGIEVAETPADFNFIVDTVNEGIGNTEMCGDKVETFRLNGYTLELIGVIGDERLPTITELKSEDFVGREYDALTLSFDLDGDGSPDTIKSAYWERWGRLTSWQIEFGNGLVYEGDSSPKRIGVLKSKTNDVYDLVIECNEVLKWNGSTYE